MTHLLDTNAVSFVMRGEGAVVERRLSYPRDEVRICQPVIAEIEYGLARLPRSARRTRLRSQFDLLLGELGRVAWTDDVSRAFGAIKTDLERRGVRIEDLDAAVAAHAVALRAVMVTDNVRHMRRIRGLKLENWMG